MHDWKLRHDVGTIAESPQGRQFLHLLDSLVAPDGGAHEESLLSSEPAGRRLYRICGPAGHALFVAIDAVAEGPEWVARYGYRHTSSDGGHVVQAELVTRRWDPVLGGDVDDATRRARAALDGDCLYLAHVPAQRQPEQLCGIAWEHLVRAASLGDASTAEPEVSERDTVVRLAGPFRGLAPERHASN